MKEPDEHAPRPDAPPERTPDAPDENALPRPEKPSEALEVELAMLESVAAEPPPKVAPERSETA